MIDEHILICCSGQTGSGKTFTMLHPGNGVYVLAAKAILEALRAPSRHHFTVTMGFFEIYQGQLYDLLQGKQRIFAREDKHQQVQIVGLKQVTFSNLEEFKVLVQQGIHERRTGLNCPLLVLFASIVLRCHWRQFRQLAIPCHPTDYIAD
jgi:hypothetical protein